MRRGRLLILVGVVLLIGTAAILVLRPMLTPPAAGTPQAAEATPTPPDVTLIVIAAQDIPRGAVITSDVLLLAPAPVSLLPQGAIFSIEEVVGRLAFQDLRRGNPVLATQVVVNALDLTDSGSYASLLIPPGYVAVSLPLERLSGVSLLLEPGDRVDVLITLLFVDLDQDFQSTLPNYTYLVSPPAPASEENPAPGVVGITSGSYSPSALICRRNDESGFGFPFCEGPQEAQRPRLVTQRIVQGATVLHVGMAPLERPAPATPTPAVTAGAPTVTPTGAPPPTAVPRPDIITLIVTPQDALVLNYALKTGADLAFVLRAAGDTALITTESVTLQYLIEHFNISVPAKQPYGTQPRQDQVIKPELDEVILP